MDFILVQIMSSSYFPKWILALGRIKKALFERNLILSNKEDICSHLTVCHHEFILTFVKRKQLLNGSLQVKHVVGNGPQAAVE